MPRPRSNPRRAAPVARQFGGVEGRNPGPMFAIDLRDHLLISWAGKIFEIGPTAEDFRLLERLAGAAAGRIERKEAEGYADV